MDPTEDVPDNRILTEEVIANIYVTRHTMTVPAQPTADLNYYLRAENIATYLRASIAHLQEVANVFQSKQNDIYTTKKGDLHDIYLWHRIELANLQGRMGRVIDALVCSSRTYYSIFEIANKPL